MHENKLTVPRWPWNVLIQVFVGLKEIKILYSNQSSFPQAVSKNERTTGIACEIIKKCLTI